jgi:hypothetical protein
VHLVCAEEKVPVLHSIDFYSLSKLVLTKNRGRNHCMEDGLTLRRIDLAGHDGRDRPIFPVLQSPKLQRGPGPNSRLPLAIFIKPVAMVLNPDISTNESWAASALNGCRDKGYPVSTEMATCVIAHGCIQASTHDVPPMAKRRQAGN